MCNVDFYDVESVSSPFSEFHAENWEFQSIEKAPVEGYSLRGPYCSGV